MSRQDNKLKRQHELAVAKHFIKQYNRMQNSGLAIVRQREAPDFELRDGNSGKILGLEVTTAYYNTPDAKSSWQMASKKIQRYDSGVMVNPDESLEQSISKVIRDHNEKNYQPR